MATHMTEGAAATALLTSGGSESLSALQAAIVVIGLPCTILVSLICVAIWRALKIAHGEMDPFGPQFECGLFDCWFTQPFKRLEISDSRRLFAKFVANIFLAPVTVCNAFNMLDGVGSRL